MPISPELLNEIRTDQYTAESLTLQGMELTDADMIELSEALSTNTHIKLLDLEANNIGDTGAEALAQTGIEALNLTANCVGPMGASYLANSHLLRSLNLTANPNIGSEGAQMFANTAPYLVELCLDECGVGNIGASAVLSNTNLKKIGLATNDIDDEGVAQIPANSELRDLDLDQNNISNEGAKSIAKSEKLEKVNLHSNRISAEGAAALATNNSILVLDLGQNDLMGDGLLAIFESHSIQKLNLSNCDIKFSEVSSLPYNSSLTYLNLNFNKLDDRCKTVLKAIASIPTLEELNLCRNKIGNEGAKILYQFRSPSLKEIDLNSNPLDERFIKAGFTLKST